MPLEVLILGVAAFSIALNAYLLLGYKNALELRLGSIERKLEDIQDHLRFHP
jgi:hypothetical protein